MHSPTLSSFVNVHHPPAISKTWKANFATKNEGTTGRASPMQRVLTPVTMRYSTPPPPVHSVKEQILPGQRSPFLASFSTRTPPAPMLPPTARQLVGVNSPLHPPASFVKRHYDERKSLQTSRTTPSLKSPPYVFNGESTNKPPSEISSLLTAFIDDVDVPSRADSQENASTSCDSGVQKVPKHSMMHSMALSSTISGVSTCAYRSGSSNGSSTDMKDSPSHSYTAEQWEAFHELEEAELRNEIRRLETIVVEERSRGHQLQQTFADELMAQKDAHTRDIAMLEDMLAKVMEENSNLSMMVRRLCAQVGKAQKDQSSCDGLEPA